MPWTIADVDKHKKGLSAEGKRKWVATANSVLADCIKKGGTDATCAPKAIRIANGVTGNASAEELAEAVLYFGEEQESSYSSYKKKQEGGYHVTQQVHQGRNHLVVPVVMMVEGVHNGSHGPMLHTIEELGRFPASWNGIPVVIDHPEDGGHSISANEPDVIDARMVGRVYNTRVDGVRLIAQAWLDEEKLRQLSSIILAQVQAGEPIEVSLGMFTEELHTAGVWNTEQYEAIARNHRPDHLALLPGGLGACSVEDGCGIRANNKKGGSIKVKEVTEVFQAIKNLNKEGFSVHQISDNADKGYKEIVDAVRQKLDSMDSDSSIHFLQEVFDDTVVYEVRLRMGGSRLFKQGYTYATGVVELQGNPTEVRKKVEYVALAEGSGMKRTKFENNINKEVNVMDEKVNCPACKQKITALIGDGKGKFTETHRTWLETLSEDQLDLLAPTIVEKEKIVPQGTPLTDAQKAALAFGEKQLKARRDGMIKVIQDNAGKEIWTDEILKNTNDDMLERVFNSVRKEGEEVVDYSLLGESKPPEASGKIAPMLIPGTKVKTESK